MALLGEVLHLANWYPNRYNPHEAVWIRNHIQALSKYCVNHVFHLEIIKNKTWRVESGSNADQSSYMFVFCPIEKWFVKEFIYFFLVLYVLIVRAKLSRISTINFHIAYPMCTYLKCIQLIARKPIFITEHWSAYHHHFNVENRSKLKRIKDIFRTKNCTTLLISHALQSDIEVFCDQQTNVDFKVIPNTVDTHIFDYAPRLNPESVRFFMVSKWQSPKTPDIVLRAFARLLAQHPFLQLCIAGYGDLYPQLEALAKQLNISSHVDFVGRLDAADIAVEMNRSHVFLHASQYETFSVVCAEALCCGVPVVASAVGGLKEVVSEHSGLLVESEAEWDDALETMVRTIHTYDRERIAKRAQARYSFESVGRQYFEAISGQVETDSYANTSSDR